MAAFVANGISFLFKVYHRIYCHRALQWSKHQILNMQEGKNLLIVGDVHGCFDEFEELYLLAKSKSDKELTVVMVGDMINKGPKNIEMLNYLINNKNIHCIRGNHENWVMSVADNHTKNDLPEWISQLDQNHKEFMRNLPYTFLIPKLNLLIIHAGVVPGLPLERQTENDMANIRCVKWVNDNFHGQTLVGTSRWDGVPWTKCWKGPEHIYFGHDAVSKLQLHKYCTGLDTGCVYGGKLTGILFHLPQNFNQITKHEDIKKEFLTITPHKVYKAVS